MLDLDWLDGRIGEAWSGAVPDGSHINVVLAKRGSPTAAAAVTALAVPTRGHAPVAVCLGAGNMVRPATIMTNKATAEMELHQRITWGAAQLGIGAGVMDTVDDGTIPAEQAGEIVILVAAWVDPAATDEVRVRRASRDATVRAIRDALAGAPVERVRELAELREAATNAFYGAG